MLTVGIDHLNQRGHRRCIAKLAECLHGGSLWVSLTVRLLHDGNQRWNKIGLAALSR
jgi:hypothetical protein